VSGLRGRERGPPSCRGAQPGLDVGPDSCVQVGELTFEPVVEGRGAIVVEQVEVIQDLDGAFDGKPISAQRGKQFGETDLVAIDEAGQQDDQRPVDVVAHPAGPSAGFADGRRGLPTARQDWVGQDGVPATVEPAVVARCIEKAALCPARVRGGCDRLGSRCAALPALLIGAGSARPRSLQTCEEQLLVADGAQERFELGDLAVAVQRGLSPA